MSAEEQIPTEGLAASAARGSLGEWITPRRALTIVAILLSIVLVLLIIFLLLSIGTEVDTGGESPAVQGISAEVVITGPGEGANPRFERPMGVAWSPDGTRVYVADSELDRVCVFDENGVFITEFGGTGIAKPALGYTKTWTPGNLNFPVDVAVDDEGLVYIADFYNDSISVFSAEGEFIRRFPDPDVPTGKGSSGRGGRGIAVTAIDVVGERVYATDGYQVLVFALDGQLIRQFGRPGSGPGELDRPNGIAVSVEGVIYVSDSNNNRLVAYTRDSEPLWTLGDRLPPSTVSAGPDEVILPRGLTLMDGKSLLVADAIGQQLGEVSLEGEALAVFGRRGADPGELNFPNDVDWHNGRIAIADKENNRVQIVRLTGR